MSDTFFGADPVPSTQSQVILKVPRDVSVENKQVFKNPLISPRHAAWCAQYVFEHILGKYLGLGANFCPFTTLFFVHFYFFFRDGVLEIALFGALKKYIYIRRLI